MLTIALHGLCVTARHKNSQGHAKRCAACGCGFNVQAVTSVLALAWSCYAATLPSSEPDALVSLALKAVAMLEQCSKAAAEAAARGSAAESQGNIGACLSGGRCCGSTSTQ